MCSLDNSEQRPDEEGYKTLLLMVLAVKPLQFPNALAAPVRDSGQLVLLGLDALTGEHLLGHTARAAAASCSEARGLGSQKLVRPPDFTQRKCLSETKIQPC